VFLCILARGTLDSLWVNHEIELASAAGKPMVPLFLEDFAIPSIEEVPAHVQELLQYQGVRVLDRNNLYVESAIGQLAESIRRTAVS
jgi:hypothetical protein